MIGPGTGVRVYLACGVTDMRKGISGLGQLAQTVLRQKPTIGAVFAFRGRRGDRVKLPVLGWAGILPVLQGLAAWPFSLAFCCRRDGAADVGTTRDALGRHRLEAPKLGRAACPCGLIFVSESTCFHGYSCPWLVSGIMLSAAQNVPEDPALLKAIIADLQAEYAKLAATVRAHDLVVQALRLRIAKLKKQAFGRSSEKIEREIEQLELALEDILVAAAQTVASPSDVEEDEATAHVDSARAMARRPRVAPDTPRERKELDPGSACPDCRGELRLVGEDVSEIIEMITAKLKVIEVARPKKSCRCCEKMVQVPAPSRPIPGSMAGSSLLA